MTERRLTGVDFEALRQHTDLPDSAVRLLSKTEKEICFDLNLVKDDGALIEADCYVVYANTARGPAKGGIRFSEHVSLAETRDLAERMVYKTALTGIPFGGGKSGIRLDPHSLTRFEKVAVIKEFVHMIKEELVHGSYIPAPDLGTTPYDMAVVYGEVHIPEAVTGKPPSVGGLPGRREATGEGVAHATVRSLTEFLKKRPQGARIAVQGFGNVGSWTCSFLADAGAKIVAASDLSGAIYNEKGLDVKALMAHVDRREPVTSFEGDALTNEELLALHVDVLIPAAIEDVLNKETAPTVCAPLIVEAANGPTTREADGILAANGITVIPDILANSGGVIASYVEWRNAKSGSLTDAADTYDTINSRIDKAFDDMCERSRRCCVGLRLASQIIAVEGIVRSMRDRVWI